MDIARKSAEMAVKEHALYACSDGGLNALSQERGAFVTLTRGGRLRGCIGYVEPVKPLCDTVGTWPLRQRRPTSVSSPLPPLSWPDLQYEISVLSSLRRVKDVKEIQVGKHGLLIRKGDHEGLLLPQVATENKWDLTTFLQQTCVKAGLPPSAGRTKTPTSSPLRRLCSGREK